jgi:hypothetical protein
MCAHTQKTQIEEAVWRRVVQKMYDKRDCTAIFKMVRGRGRAKTNGDKENRQVSANVRPKARSLSREANKLLFTDFLKVILDF